MENGNTCKHGSKEDCLKRGEGKVWCPDSGTATTLAAACQSSCPAFCTGDPSAEVEPHETNINAGCPTNDVRQWSRQYLEIDLCSTSDDEVRDDRRVSGFAVQGDPSYPNLFVANYVVSYQSVADAANNEWRFYNAEIYDGLTYSAISEGAALLGQATNLTGTTGEQHVVSKIAVVPFDACKVRLHPIAWSGTRMALRAEVFSCLVEFPWESIQSYVESITLTAYDCDSAMVKGEPAFRKWSEGRGGSGVIYETRKKELSFNSGETRLFTAYQRRSISGSGMLSKALLCHESEMESDTLGQQCCVTKKSLRLAEVWNDQARETLMA